MKIKIASNLLDLDYVFNVEELNAYSQYGFSSGVSQIGDNESSLYMKDLFKYYDKNYWCGFGFYVHFLNDNYQFIKLTKDYEESKRLYEKFIEYWNNNESKIPEIK